MLCNSKTHISLPSLLFFSPTLLLLLLLLLLSRFSRVRSVRPHRRQPTRLPCLWDSPGKNTGVGCHFLLQCMKVKSESEVAQSCPTPSDPMDCSLPGSSIHGIFQARVLEWRAIAFSVTHSPSHSKCSCLRVCQLVKIAPPQALKFQQHALHAQHPKLPFWLQDLAF